MKACGHSQVRRHLGHWELVLETELDEQPICGGQCPQGVLEGTVDVRNPDGILSTHPALVNQDGQVDLGADQVDQAASGSLILRLGVRIVGDRAIATIPMPPMIETDPLSYHDEPGGKLAPAIGDVGTETPAVFLAELIQHLGVTVHGAVMVAATGPRDVKEEPAICAREVGPGGLPGGRVAGMEETIQYGGDSVGHGCPYSCFRLRPSPVPDWPLGRRSRIQLDPRARVDPRGRRWSISARRDEGGVFLHGATVRFHDTVSRPEICKSLKCNTLFRSTGNDRRPVCSLPEVPTRACVLPCERADGPLETEMIADWSIARIRGARGVTLALGILTLGVLGCGDDLTRPDAFHATKCELPLALLAGADPQPFAFGDLREAFLHAAGPMGSALGSSEKVDLLIQAMNALGAEVETRSMDTACRLLLLASESLAALEDSPETLPDRDAIHLVLILAVGVVQAGLP